MLFFFPFNFLVVTLSIPALGICYIFFQTNNQKIKNISILVSFVTFVCSLFMWFSFDKFSTNFQFVCSLPWLSFYNINLTLGIDGISLLLIVLTTFLLPLCLLTSQNTIKSDIKLYYILFLLLELLLLLVFSTLDLMFFFIFFETVLIPMFLIIGIWGSRERKIRASFFLSLYTLAGSVLMLLAILYLHNTFGTTNYQYLLLVEISPFSQKLCWLAFFIAFAIKVPMLPFHIWLPEAHVEAPTAGSVLLAGILLKLGSYGLLRFSLPLFPIASIYFKPLVCTMAVVSIVYASLTAIRQTDLKRVIAYASVSHMNCIIIGLFSFTVEGVEGSIIQMLSHGLVSSALFLSIGVLYDRYHTRLIAYYSGLTMVMPLFSVFFLFYSLANIALPGTSSFIGEFLILLGLFSFNRTLAVCALMSMVLGGVYSLWVYNRILFGNLRTTFLKQFKDMTPTEIFIHVPLVFSILVMGIYPTIFTDIFHTSVTELMLPIQYAMEIQNV